ncbi:MAG: restriction endonuclease subunit M [Oscillospiraceae bacterium]|nr:restriction endonuclease subunit M [Oscillospiraceae bacterium]
MLFSFNLDVVEEEIQQYERALLDVLLFDRSSRKNIIWATDSYEYLGEGYAAGEEVHPELIDGENRKLIQPRIAKTFEAQDIRTKDSAEVFTPSWVCNNQNNLVDDSWFGRTGVFNSEDGRTWIVNKEKIPFAEKGKHTWKKYVDAKRLEITCGEAPYIVSRYDTVTGDSIPICERIGLLDRKLRVVNENTVDETDWIKWATRAFQAVYAFEYQGDNLLLARENLLLTFIEYYRDRFKKSPDKRLLLQIARIISWNIWQMDGQKYVIPLSCKPVVYEDTFFFGEFNDEHPCPGCSKGAIHEHTGIYCRVFDWREKASLPFISMVKGAKT